MAIPSFRLPVVCRCGHFHAKPEEVVMDVCEECQIPPCIHLVPADGEPLPFTPYVPEAQA